MSLVVAELGLGIRASWVTSNSPCFRPTTWPPARDWPVSVDRDGSVLSRWGEPVWDLSPIAGTAMKLNFGDGIGYIGVSIDSANADILRQMVTYRMFGPRSAKSAKALQGFFSIVRPIVAVCSRNGILATDLMRYPKVLDQIPSILPASRYRVALGELHRIFDARDSLGFIFVDSAGIRRLAEGTPKHQTIQTPYIPPRIWSYQVTRLRECLNDFTLHRESLRALFALCTEGYIKNYGSLAGSLSKNKDPNKTPFRQATDERPGCVYFGPFIAALDRLGLTQLFLKWLAMDRETLTVRQFSSYLSLVTVAGLAYIANFTLQRKEEVAALRCSCLIWEQDEKLGRVPIICGETTKTDPDSDARWVASPSIEIAVEVLSEIARLRMQFDSANKIIAPSKEDQMDPYLFSAPNEPWGSGRPTAYHIRSESNSLGETLRDYPGLLDHEQILITSDDLKIAQQLTPNLPSDKFAVGLPWPFAWHQYRRTGAVNMFASGLISDSSMQQLLKHSTRLMPLYYGRGYTKLRLNENLEMAIVAAMYESLANQLILAMTDRFVSPNLDAKQESKAVNIITTKDVKKLVIWAKSGKVSFREHRLGACMRVGFCGYGGIESVSRCTGGDGDKPCPDVRYDREKEPLIRVDLQRMSEEIALLPKESPRYGALLAEKRGMENYLDAILKI
jgi:hypothetical protein